MTTVRPQTHLKNLSARFPLVFKNMEKMWADKGKDIPSWPAWCYVPMGGAYAALCAAMDKAMLDPAEIYMVGELSALAAWRASMGIYRFDPTLESLLWETPSAGNIPVDVLTRIPEHCVYIETPGREAIGLKLHGFYSHLESDSNTGGMELRFLLDTEARLIPIVLHLIPGRSLEECARDTMVNAPNLPPMSDEVSRHSALYGSVMEPLLSLVLYLCSTSSEIRDPSDPEARPGPPKPVKTKTGWRNFPPHGPRAWEVGFRIGAAIRSYRESERDAGAATGGHAAPRPHIRRAHWHSYWTGPRSARKILVHWLPPIPVKIEAGKIIPTIHHVKEKSNGHHKKNVLEM